MIIWNRVTTYSKFLAVIFFIGILPAWTFYLGTQYQKTIDTFSDATVQNFIINKKDNVSVTTSTSTPIKDQIKINSGIRGTVTIGPTCPVERNPPDPNCADKPYNPTLSVSSKATGIAKTFKVTSNGKFEIALVPGIYVIKNTGEAILPRMSDVEVSVSNNTYTDVNIEFDSGIR
ncbi:MAG: hypothetical protein M3Q24_02300 [bacterium]|nr:hypothetical protein [bacterium]